MPPPYLGNCLCGQVQFQLCAEPLTFYACHCTDCQRRTGGSMRLAMWVARSSLQVLAGEPSLLQFQGSPGRPRRSKACSVCDTRLWAEPADKPSLAILFPGSLQNPGHFKPVAHLWVRSALSWVTIPEGVAQYQTQPDDPKELIRLWQAKHGAPGLAAT
jgi:hypothetical protein